jgi:sugar lactone lactonase YvrE
VKRTPLRWSAIAALLFAAVAAATAPPQTERDTIVRAREAAEEAQAKNNPQALFRALTELDHLTPGNPRVQKLLAYAEAQLGRPQDALTRLQRLALMHLTFRDLAAPAFAPLRKLPGYGALEKSFVANGMPISRATTIRTLTEPDLIAEDVAYDPLSRAFFVSSVRHRKIRILPADGPERDWVTEGRDGVWSILALAVDSNRRILWASTAAMNEAAVPKEEVGRSALLAYDLATGALRGRYDLREKGEHVLGDMTLAPTGDIYISDSISGAVYVLRRNAKGFEDIVRPGIFVSPQNPALTPDGKRLFVADYPRGIAVVDLASHGVSWLPHPQDLVTGGIDGMYLVGDSIWAVQNGTTPNRVVRLQLDPSLSRIVRWELVESASTQLGSPTHGVIVDGDFYFIGRSGWEHMDDNGAPKKGEHFEPPLLLRAPLGWPRP